MSDAEDIIARLERDYGGRGVIAEAIAALRAPRVTTGDERDIKAARAELACEAELGGPAPSVDRIHRLAAFRARARAEAFEEAADFVHQSIGLPENSLLRGLICDRLRSLAGGGT